jgi:predicted Ser/Thr protein kinase
MNDFMQINVKKQSDNKLIIYNPTVYPLVGQGRHGAIFRLASDICVKIYADEAHAEIEANVYRRINGSPIIPKLYEVGKNYIIIEYIDGPNLRDYLIEKGKISKGTSKRIIFLFDEIKRLGFSRLDESLRHILVAQDKALKIVDHFYAFTQLDPYPVKFLRQLNEIGFLDQFLKDVLHLYPHIYLHWKNVMPQYFNTD